MDKIDDIIEKIKAILLDIKDEKTYSYLKEKYGITRGEAADIKYLSENDLRNMRSKIEYIREQKDREVSTRKISANLGMGTWATIYILKQLGYDAKKRNTRVDNSVIELESMWRAYKSGQTIKNIATIFGHSDEDTKTIIAGFDKRIEKRRKVYSTKKESFDEEDERKKLQKYLKVSDELIDYMIKGTPITEKKRKEDKIEGDER